MEFPKASNSFSHEVSEDMDTATGYCLDCDMFIAEIRSGEDWIL